MRLIEPSMLDLLNLCYNARSDEIEQYKALIGPWNYEEVAIGFYNKPGIKFGIIGDDGIVVCAGGWEHVITGVWQSWMVGTDDYWKKYWRSITKHSRSTMDHLLDEGEARRLQTGALASRVEACEWYRRGLKMHHESTFRNFGFNGEDMVMFVRLKER